MERTSLTPSLILSRAILLLGALVVALGLTNHAQSARPDRRPDQPSTSSESLPALSLLSIPIRPLAQRQAVRLSLGLCDETETGFGRPDWLLGRPLSHPA